MLNALVKSKYKRCAFISSFRIVAIVHTRATESGRRSISYEIVVSLGNFFFYFYFCDSDNRKCAWVWVSVYVGFVLHLFFFCSFFICRMWPMPCTDKECLFHRKFCLFIFEASPCAHFIANYFSVNAWKMSADLFWKFVENSWKSQKSTAINVECFFFIRSISVNISIFSTMKSMCARYVQHFLFMSFSMHSLGLHRFFLLFYRCCSECISMRWRVQSFCFLIFFFFFTTYKTIKL